MSLENLKFRAWDKGTDLMNEVTVIDFESEEVYYHHWRYGHSEAIPIRDIELMQSTGLKDKNDVEIFEGDIVSCFNEGMSTVVFRYGTFGLLCNGYFEGFINVLDNFEVIGNIYENGDLLK